MRQALRQGASRRSCPALVVRLVRVLAGSPSLVDACTATFFPGVTPCTLPLPGLRCTAFSPRAPRGSLPEGRRGAAAR
jgi:hypothetical protein